MRSTFKQKKRKLYIRRKDGNTSYILCMIHNTNIETLKRFFDPHFNILFPRYKNQPLRASLLDVSTQLIYSANNII